jgi:cation diffusion facilitator CzcD-associated flavoprotein CzcO
VSGTHGDEEVPVAGRPAVTIIGAGFGGIGMAARLLRAGFRDVTVFERGDRVGGVWAANTYPGAACDIPAALYSFSFAPKTDWSRRYPPQEEIRAYLEETAERSGVLPLIRFGTEVRDARWDGGGWVLTLGDGGTHRTDVLVSACGQLTRPSVPAIPGLEDFAGTAFHSARWRHDHDLTGRRVAVVGTGASAIQFVPHVVREAAHTTLFQREAPHVVPKPDRVYGPGLRTAFRRVPGLLALDRALTYARLEWRALGFTRRPELLQVADRMNERLRAAQVGDPGLRDRLAPVGAPGCKRILLSDDYYPALTQPNVSLVTHGIKEIREHSVVTSDGTAYEADALIFGTGFHVSDFPVAQRIAGPDGVSLAQRWSAKPVRTAFRGTTTAGFPNLFVLTGPNTGLGHTSQVFMIEAQIRYVVSALLHTSRHGIDRIEVRPASQAAFDRVVQRKMRPTVWMTGGCKSWYLDAEGRNVSLWPDFTWIYAWQTRRFDPSNYDLTGSLTEVPGALAR